MSKIIKINTSAILEYSAQLQDVEKRLKIIHKKCHSILSMVHCPER